ncbi:MAG: hypothetical protein HQ507_10625 [Candidatus Marinimicrobia bacterium]|nr:hypothetical protein [Candidatus Neomarinimicrobiota bacterium]
MKNINSLFLAVSFALTILACAEDPSHTNIFDPETPNDFPDSVRLSPELVGMISDDLITLNWTQSGINDFKAYHIYRSMEAGVNDASTLVTSLPYPFLTSSTDVDLQPNTEYYYRVSVEDKGGLVTYSNELKISTAPETIFCLRIVREGSGTDFNYHCSKADALSEDNSIYLFFAVLDKRWELSMWTWKADDSMVTDRGGWHPNRDGTTLISGDSDQDGMPDMYEIITNTDPFDPTSFSNIEPEVFPFIVPAQILVIKEPGSTSTTVFVLFMETPYYSDSKILKFIGDFETHDFSLDMNWGDNGILRAGIGRVFGISKLSSSRILLAKRQIYDIYDFSGNLIFTSGDLPIRIGVVSEGSNTPGGDHYLYLTNWDGQIYKLDESGNELTHWIGFEENRGSLVPIGLYADERGNVFITDGQRNTVNRYDSNGDFISRWDGANYNTTKPFFFDNDVATFGHASIAGSGANIVIVDMNTAIYRAIY